MASYNSNTNTPPSPLSGLFDQARLWWDGSPTSTRIISVGLAFLVVMCLAGAAMLATAPDYQDLFSGLDPQDAAAIAAKLDDAHVKYELIDNDTTIRVPSADKDRLRMEMVRDGLPAKTGSVVGSDWLDKIGMSTTSNVSDQYIKMAQESELATTISSLNEIETAAVHISPGTNSPFATDNAPPTASVVVGLKQGMNLTNDQIMGIANLVAKAVPGLDVKDVAVVDSNGNQLWDGGEEAGPTGMASNRLTAEHQYSDDLRKEMQAYLDAVLGPHKSLVSVHAELNYNQIHSHLTNFSKGTILSSQQTEEKYSGSAGPANPSPAGIASNSAASVPQYPNSSGGGKSGDYTNSQETDNYEPNKVETDTQQAPGSVQRLAVAVLIDSKIPQSTVAPIQSYLSTLAGVMPGDPSRAVTVQSVPFTNTAIQDQQNMMKTIDSQKRTDDLLKIASVGAVAVILLFIFLKSSRVALPKQSEQALLQQESQHRQALGHEEDYHPEQITHDEPMTIEQALGEMPMPLPMAAERPNRPKRKPLVPEIEEHMDLKLESVREMVKAHPSSVALLIKGWVADESSEGSR